MTKQVIPEAAVEAAAEAEWVRCGSYYPGVTWETEEPNYREYLRDAMRGALEAAAPHMLADILEDVANTAETDELSTAAEVIYDLRRHAKDLRPTK